MKALTCILAAAGLLVAADAVAAALPKGDPVRGEKLYQECRGCHAYNSTLVGPKHCGVYGRRAGSVEGYAYSEAMKKSGIVWNEETLDAYLKSPDSLIPGVNMTAPPVANAQDRADIIAYLKAGLDPDICGPATNANPAK
jgi:cytochrome c